MATIIQLRRDTAANWTANNPILADGEPGYEKDTKKEKIGDGVTPWNDLPYKTTGSDPGGGETSTPDPLVITQNHILTTENNNQLITAEDYASIIIPSGLGLKYRVTISRDTAKTVSVTAVENVVLQYPKGFAAQILSQHDGITLAPKKIVEGVEYWGVYGALKEGFQDAPTIFNIADTSVVTTYTIFPIIYKSSDWPELTTTKDYFMTYSTDHDGGTAGGIYWAEMDDPEGTGFIERGTIISGNQAESGLLHRMGDGRIGIFYHTYQESGYVINQETRLKTTIGGVLHTATWRDDGRPIPVEAGNNHTGYLKIHLRANGTRVGIHSVNGTGSGQTGVSESTDGGYTWIRVVPSIDFTQGMPTGMTLKNRPIIFPFTQNETVYGVVGYFTAANLSEGHLGVFELDNNFLPLTFLKEINYFPPYDGQMYEENQMGYVTLYGTTMVRLLKLYLPELI